MYIYIGIQTHVCVWVKKGKTYQSNWTTFRQQLLMPMPPAYPEINQTISINVRMYNTRAFQFQHQFSITSNCRFLFNVNIFHFYEHTSIHIYLHMYVHKSIDSDSKQCILFFILLMHFFFLIFYLVHLCHQLLQPQPHRRQPQYSLTLPTMGKARYFIHLSSVQKRIVDWKGGCGRWKACKVI